MREYAKLPKWVYKANSGDEFEDNSPLLLTDLKITNATLKEPVGPDAVEYSYRLKDFQEGYTILTNRTVHSSTNCSLVEVGKQGQYWRWSNWERTGPFSMEDFHHDSIIHGRSFNKVNFEFG